MKILKSSATGFNAYSRHELNMAFWMMIRTTFDETGFAMNIARPGASKVVTAATVGYPARKSEMADNN